LLAYLFTYCSTNTNVNSTFHPSGVAKSAGRLAGVGRGAFACAGWQ